MVELWVDLLADYWAVQMEPRKADLMVAHWADARVAPMAVMKAVLKVWRWVD